MVCPRRRKLKAQVPDIKSSLSMITKLREKKVGSTLNRGRGQNGKSKETPIN